MDIADILNKACYVLVEGNGGNCSESMLLHGHYIVTSHS